MFVDEERGVSSEDNLTIGALGENLEDLSQMTLVLRMEMELWLINKYNTSYAVALNNIFDHGDDSLLS
jgi:hypothetical protein